MAFYSNEEICRLRDRWRDKEDLVNEILRILCQRSTFDNDAQVELEQSKFLKQANKALSDVGFCEPIPKLRPISPKDMELKIPRLDLRGIIITGRDCSGICLRCACLDYAQISYSSFQKANL